MMVISVALRSTSAIALCAAVLMACSISAQAHNGVVHKNEEEARQHRALDAANTPGFPDIKGGDYDLVDQYGARRSSKDPDGRYQLLFFGYANCQAICSVALPRMAEVTERLEEDGTLVTPVMITVDPERDTREALAEASQKHHKRLIGLTGSDSALAAAYKAFQVERKVVFTHPDHGDVYAHGSYIYLLAPDGSFKTLFPPILSPKRIGELVQEYIAGKRS
ncbi:MAG: SCO family protein [Filomicrobium sp.]